MTNELKVPGIDTRDFEVYVGLLRQEAEQCNIENVLLTFMEVASQAEFLMLEANHRSRRSSQAISTNPIIEREKQIAHEIATILAEKCACKSGRRGKR